ncbi:MAG TPA: transporter [Verrucomicrobiae bacterium]|nr:transporter [Verrucomicrobiae bacterium]
MKIRFGRLLLAAGMLWLPLLLSAQPTAHYTPGVEGIKGASLPPPGFYVRDYNVVYYATRANDASGNNAHVPNFRAFTYANVPRVIWISDTQVLGGYVGVDALLPFLYQSLRVPGYDQGTLGVGDFFAESTLSWHPRQFDLAVGLGVWAPTGDAPTQPGPSTRAGLGYWTPMLTAGATWYLDTNKTWAVSLLNRYEFNTKQRDTHITPGQAYTLEWGLSKTVAKVIDLGAVGYYQQQVTTDRGTGASPDRDRVLAVGPEINVVFPGPMLFASFRYNYEFLAQSRAQGHTFTLTLTKRF